MRGRRLKSTAVVLEARFALSRLALHNATLFILVSIMSKTLDVQKGNADVEWTIWVRNCHRGTECNSWLNTKRHVYSEVSLPGVDAIFATEGVFHREPSVVELQGREASLVQTHHLSVGQRQRSAVGAVAWKGVREQRRVGWEMKGLVVTLIWRTGGWNAFIIATSDAPQRGRRSDISETYSMQGLLGKVKHDTTAFPNCRNSQLFKVALYHLHH